ncbi:MAG TPA: Hsp70 family protein [Pyrinomonadaceae bacterium]|jgi:molecular chaperone DnaK (HSP70)
MGKSIVVGIDLGTTNSAIAYINEFGRPEVLANSEGKKITPSVVQLRADGSALVGEAAKLELALEKENTAHFFKRDMGTPVFYEYHGRSYTPVDLSAELLKQLKLNAEAALNTEIRRAIITVPAYFYDGPRVATREAGEKAGLEVVQIINEPTAAALAYGLKQSGREEVVLVYDLGGGTFDITLVRISPEAIEVIGTDGKHTLGGKDWDDRLLEHLCEQFEQRQGVNPLDDPYAFQELLLRAEEAKKALSSRASTIVPINCHGRMDRIEVTREQFESLTGDLLSQTQTLMNKVLEETGYDYSRVGSVLMVGGSTRMPACQELVRRLTGQAPNASVNPDECVALGAALQGAQYDESSAKGMTYQPAQAERAGGLMMRRSVQDVMSHSMGMIAVSADGNRYLNSILIPKNQHIPCSEVRPYKVRTRDGVDNKTSVYVTQGEGEDLGNCSFVGKYVISNIAHDKKDAILNISYEYDRSGVVSVSATEKKSGRTLAVKKEPVPEDMTWIYKSPKELAKVAHKTIHLVIDVSGSMSGQPLEEAKQAIHKFIKSSDLANTSIGIIAFSDNAYNIVEATQDGRKLSSGADSLSIDGGTSEPLTYVFAKLKQWKGLRYCVVLTDGQWSGQDRAISVSQEMRKEGIEIIAIGFGSADEDFLRQIATSDQSAMLVGSGDLTSTFENIAQVLVEGGGESFASGLFFRRR